MSGTAAVIVVYRDGASLLRACVESLLAQDLPGLAVVLVDHSEDGGDAAALARESPGLLVVRPRANRGFAAGVNAGTAAVPEARFLLTLNPDATAPPGWARAMVAECERTGAAMVAARALSASDPARLDSEGIVLSRDGQGHLRGHEEPAGSPPPARPEPLLGPSGVAALYRRDLLETLGGFPEAYFLYYEDTEVAFRARVLGAACGYVPDPPVRHAHLSGAGRRKTFHLQRGRLLFLLRNWPLSWWSRDLHVIVGRDLLSIAGAAARGDLPAALSARGSVLLGVLPALAARRAWAKTREAARVRNATGGPGDARGREADRGGEPMPLRNRIVPPRPLSYFGRRASSRAVAGSVAPR